MTKKKAPTTLGKQVRDAQKVMRGWSAEKRKNVRLEGTVFYKRIGDRT